MSATENVCGGSYNNHGKDCPDCVRFMDDCDGATGWTMEEGAWVFGPDEIGDGDEV